MWSPCEICPGVFELWPLTEKVSTSLVMDNPDLIVTCVVGDGESESGPLATAWHGHKYLDPKESGAVLPVCLGF